MIGLPTLYMNRTTYYDVFEDYMPRMRKGRAISKRLGSGDQFRYVLVIGYIERDAE